MTSSERVCSVDDRRCDDDYHHEEDRHTETTDSNVGAPRMALQRTARFAPSPFSVRIFFLFFSVHLYFFLGSSFFLLSPSVFPSLCVCYSFSFLGASSAAQRQCASPQPFRRCVDRVAGGFFFVVRDANTPAAAAGSSSSNGSSSIRRAPVEMILSAFRYLRYASAVAVGTRRRRQSNVDLGRAGRRAKRCRYCRRRYAESPAASVTITT